MEREEVSAISLERRKQRLVRAVSYTHLSPTSFPIAGWGFLFFGTSYIVAEGIGVVSHLQIYMKFRKIKIPVSYTHLTFECRHFINHEPAYLHAWKHGDDEPVTYVILSLIHIYFGIALTTRRASLSSDGSTLLITLTSDMEPSFSMICLLYTSRCV